MQIIFDWQRNYSSLKEKPAPWCYLQELISEEWIVYALHELSSIYLFIISLKIKYILSCTVIRNYVPFSNRAQNEHTARMLGALFNLQNCLMNLDEIWHLNSTTKFAGKIRLWGLQAKHNQCII